LLSPADEELIRRDSTLPGLRYALDGDALCELVVAQPGPVNLTKVQINYVRYKPGTSCWSGCLFHFGEKMVHGYVRALRLESPKLRKENEKPSVPGLLGPKRLLAPTLGLVISTAANDRKLPALATLVQEPERMLKRIFPDHPDFWEGTIDPINYKPARRFVAKLAHSPFAAAALKIYDAREFEKAYLNVRLLGSAASAAPWVGKSSRHRILAFEWLEGTALHRVLSNAAALRGAGAALRTFHAQNAIGLPLRTAQELSRSVLEVARGIAALRPDIKRQALQLAQRISQSIDDNAAGVATIHGDFYSTQVIVSENGEVKILDFDEAATGNPLIDLGNFLAHLERGVLNKEITESQAKLASAAFLEGYAKRDFRECRAHISSALFRLAQEPFRMRQAHWEDRIDAILRRVEGLIDAGTDRSPGPKPRRGPDVSVSDPFNVASDGAMPFVAAALNPQKAHRALSHLLSKSFSDFELREIRVVRYKERRRCLIEYQLATPEGFLTLLGKVHAKRFDEASYLVQRSLWNAGFDDHSTDCISVAQPIGAVPEWHMWLQRKVMGENALKKLSRSHQIFLAQRIAEVAHKLHNADVPPRRRPHTIRNEVELLHDRFGLVAVLRPNLQSRLDFLLEGIERLAATMPAGRTAAIHRDFYHDQVIIDGNRFYLLDFDLYCEGDPALDLGNFIAHLQESSVRRNGNSLEFQQQQQTLIDRYVELCRVDLRARIEIYTLFTLARHIYISTQFSARTPFTNALLDLCESRLLAASDSKRGGLRENTGTPTNCAR